MKNIKQLAINSYQKGKLDEKITLRVAKYLSKKELKEYIRYLKMIENKNSVTITVADIKSSNDLIKKIKSSYKNKNITVNEDKNLIAGIRILDFDTIYELNLKNRIEQTIKFLNK